MAPPAPPSSQSSGISRDCRRNLKGESFWEHGEQSKAEQSIIPTIKIPKGIIIISMIIIIKTSNDMVKQ